MDIVPLEVIYRHAFQTIGDFFAKQAEEERRKKKVAVLVEDFTNSVYYMPCDEYGYPNVHYFNYMTYESLNVTVLNEGQYVPTNMSVEEVSIMIDRPMLTQRYDWQQKPYVFMWSGRKMGSKKIPLEKLNVSELMKIAQKTIENREGLVIDEALKNKIYK